MLNSASFYWYKQYHFFFLIGKKIPLLPRGYCNKSSASRCVLGLEPEAEYRMDISEETNASNGILLEDIQDEDSRCNWDIEIIQFVVESFICMFPENESGGTKRNRQDARGEFTTFAWSTFLFCFGSKYIQWLINVLLCTISLLSTAAARIKPKLNERGGLNQPISIIRASTNSS